MLSFFMNVMPGFTKYQVIKKLVLEKPEMLDKLEEVFKRSRLDYDTIKEICARKRIALWLLDNMIEMF